MSAPGSPLSHNNNKNPPLTSSSSLSSKNPGYSNRNTKNFILEINESDVARENCNHN